MCAAHGFCMLVKTTALRQSIKYISCWQLDVWSAPLTRVRRELNFRRRAAPRVRLVLGRSGPLPGALAVLHGRHRITHRGARVH
eukprot:scaffold132632_cov78-Phaeocystis_antarctica.AAC.2